MKKLLLTVVCFTTISFCSFAQEPVKSVDLTSVITEQNNIKREFNSLRGEVSVLKNKNAKAESRISALESLNKDLSLKLDSLQKEYDNLANNQKADKSELSTIIGETNEKVLATEEILSSRTLWGLCGIIALILALATIVWAFMKKIKSGSTSISEIKKAQTSIEKAQQVMQEKSVELDTKLLNLFERQLEIIDNNKSTTELTNSEPDHSLVIKLANEIAKIETNLSKMDKSVKGYKQLVQAKDKMINNVTAYGYEIISLIGQDYNDGMQYPARFIPDDSLEEGKRIISGMVKMQVNYKGKMIQAAEIVVNQNI
jgi:hypothetical protein